MKTIVLAVVVALGCLAGSYAAASAHDAWSGRAQYAAPSDGVTSIQVSSPRSLSFSQRGAKLPPDAYAMYERLFDALDELIVKHRADVEAALRKVGATYSDAAGRSFGEKTP